MKKYMLSAAILIIMSVLLCACKGTEEAPGIIQIAEGPIRLTSNSSVPAIPSSTANIRGRVIRRDRTSSDIGIFQIVVEPDPADANPETGEAYSGPVLITIGEQTILSDDSGNSVRPSSFFTGSVVEVWFSGDSGGPDNKFEGQAVKVISQYSEVNAFDGSFPWMAATSGGNSVLSVVHGVEWNGESNSRNFYSLVNRPSGPVLDVPSEGSVNLRFSASLVEAGRYSVSYTTDPSAEEFTVMESYDNIISLKNLQLEVEPSGEPVTVYFQVTAYFSETDCVSYVFAVRVSIEESPIE